MEPSADVQDRSAVRGIEHQQSIPAGLVSFANGLERLPQASATMSTDTTALVRNGVLGQLQISDNSTTLMYDPDVQQPNLMYNPDV